MGITEALVASYSHEYIFIYLEKMFLQKDNP